MTLDGKQTRQHVGAGVLAATAAALAITAEEALRAALEDGVRWASAGHSALMLGLVLLVPGLWLGAVLAGAAQSWAPFELLEWIRGLFELRDRDEETRRVSRALAAGATLAGWLGVSVAVTRTLAARIVRPELEAVAVPLVLLVLALGAWGTGVTLTRALGALLAQRENLVGKQVGLCSVPALMALGVCLVVGGVVAARAPLTALLYRLDGDPLWAAGSGAVAVVAVLLVAGTDLGERGVVRLTTWWFLAPLVLGLSAGGVSSVRFALADEEAREGIFWQHATAARVLAALMPEDVEDGPPEGSPEASEDDQAAGASLETEAPAEEEPAAPAERADLDGGTPLDGSVTPAEKPQKAPRPHIIFISMDTVRADVLGIYGYRAHPTSPNIDAWAAGATRFQRAYSGGPCSSASFMGMLTSTLPSRLRGLTLEGDVFTLPRTARTLAQRLGNAGYRTQALMPVIGDYLRGVQRGFSEFDETFHYAEALADRGVKAVNRLARADKPTFLWIHFIDAHYPYEAHRGFGPFGNQPRDLYAQEIAFMDVHVGRVLKAIEGSGLKERAVVVLFSDHGEAFGEHGTRLHGNSLYDEEIRVPLLVAGPGVTARWVEEPASLLDLGPTVLELAGASPPKDVTGRSLVPALRGQSMEARPVLAEGCKPGTMLALVDKRKLFFRKKSGLYFLYDLAADVNERKNLFQAAPNRDDLKRRVQGLLRGR